MGEYADMMLDGTLCACCGVYLSSEGEGYPMYCSECGIPSERIPHNITTSRNAKPCKTKAQCYICKKWVKSVGLPQHIRDKH